MDLVIKDIREITGSTIARNTWINLEGRNKPNFSFANISSLETFALTRKLFLSKLFMTWFTIESRAITVITDYCSVFVMSIIIVWELFANATFDEVDRKI
jgi:hypothetical protein